MKRANSPKAIFFGLAFLTLSACQVSYPTEISSKSIPLDEAVTEDPKSQAIIAEYSDALKIEMEEIVAFAMRSFPKTQPESLIGNMLTDLIMTQVGEPNKADFVVHNYGGIRIPQLDSGMVTRGEIFEMLPFENFLVVLTLDGKTLKEFLAAVGKKGGWPISRSLKVEYHSDDKLVAWVNGIEVMDDQQFRMLTNDYIANGGDGMAMLKALKREETGILIRDALFDLFDSVKVGEGPRPTHYMLNADLENRTSYHGK